MSGGFTKNFMFAPARKQSPSTPIFPMEPTLCLIRVLVEPGKTRGSHEREISTRGSETCVWSPAFRPRKGNPKSQTPNPNKIPSSKIQKPGCSQAAWVGICDLGFYWDLVFGIWDFD